MWRRLFCMPDSTHDGPIRGHIRQTGYQRVAHGLFRPIRVEAAPDEEHLRDLEAWLLLLPPSVRFTHVRAAGCGGGPRPTRPALVRGCGPGGIPPPRPPRPGLICSRLGSRGRAGKVHGLPVEAPEEILLRAARDFGVLDLLILVDSARHLGHVDAAAMTALLSSTRPGVRNLRRAWALSTSKAESAGETTLRLFDITMGVSVDPQVELFDEAGNVVARVDLHVTGTKLVHEYDGAGHRDGRQHRVDLRRERGLGRAGFERRGFTLDDLLNHARVVMNEIDAELGRPHDYARVASWNTVIGNSLYAELGRRRMMNRWQRQMGVTDWSRTA